MTALLTGAVMAGLTRIAGDALTPPVEFLKTDASGVIEMRLASEMLVTITVHVEPRP